MVSSAGFGSRSTLVQIQPSRLVDPVHWCSGSACCPVEAEVRDRHPYAPLLSARGRAAQAAACKAAEAGSTPAGHSSDSRTQRRELTNWISSPPKRMSRVRFPSASALPHRGRENESSSDSYGCSVQDVGKFGNPPAWGAGERRFKSDHPDSQESEVSGVQFLTPDP